ncbi:MAG: 2-amino-4-hydroxy-6-hydroxymethyldihydropteridine diphosphokinase [Caldiserica bacterium]|nr:MAG: 2-amino-4-hydroxy-6-hydroxymethyldihydropteridine diphosphokinase [Caldisericota bacterium]
MVKVILSLGSNIGDREKFLKSAVEKISKFSKVVRESSIYETEPMYYKDQNTFLNKVIEIETDISPDELLSKIKKIEIEIGRKKRERYGPREIDIDIIYYGDKIVKEENLEIPHPKLYERKFVLLPLLEIEPEFEDPVTGLKVKEIFKDVKNRKERVVKCS